MPSLKKDKTATYTTNDLSLATALVAWGFTLTDIDKTDIKKALFVFKDTGTITEYVKSYWGDSKPIAPKKLLTTLKDLKSQLYSERGY